MKEKYITAVSFFFLLLPWTIFPIRTNAWALKTPAAQVIISLYLAAMVLGAVFSTFCYVRRLSRSRLMQVCVVLNDLYGFAAVCLAGLMIITAVG